jgi:hypothetical protein
VAGRARVAVWVGVGLLLQACSFGGTSEASGPIDFGDGQISDCAPADQYHHMVWDQFLRIPEDEDGKLLSVEPRDPQGLEVSRYLVLVNPAHGSVGVVTYPPKSASWKEAVPAEGATLPAGVPIFLIAEVRTTRPSGGTLAGSRLRYQIGKEKYAADTNSDLTIGTCP